MIESKLPNVGTTIFSTMSAMAAEYKAINLSQGFPDFSPPQPLLDALAQANASGKHQYPPMIGIDELRHQIKLKAADLYSADIDPDQEITVTSGATEALFVAIHAVVRQGDEVIIFDPAYDSYEPAIQLAGGTAKHINLDSMFRVNWDEVESNISTRTRAIIINSPHNPTGSVLTRDDLDQLSAIAQKHNILVISDEVYEHMVFDGQLHQSVLTHDTLRQRSFVISSFGKTYHATGWKVGYAIAPPALMREFRKVHQFVTFTTHTPSQYALAQFMAADSSHHKELPSFYQAKRDLFNELLSSTKFKFTPSAGTYFQLADYSNVSSMPDVEFAQYLTKEVGVAAIPISVFYQNPPKQSAVRFCFAKQDATLRDAVSLLAKL